MPLSGHQRLGLGLVTAESYLTWAKAHLGSQSLELGEEAQVHSLS